MCLICDLNLILNNFQGARLAVKDIEILQRNDANTYLMKIRVILAQMNAQHEAQGLITEVFEAMGQLQKTVNFKFVHIVSILHDADATLPNDSFHLLLEHVMQFIDFNKQAIRYSLDQQQLASNANTNGGEGAMFNSSRFNFTKFLASLIMKDQQETL